MSSVVEQILSEGVFFGAQAPNWRVLTETVGQEMERLGMSTAEYTQAMIQNVEENGPYLVIAPGVALLHARPDAGCLRNGILIGTATPPVEFGHSVNDPVSLVLGLSATGDMDHVALLQSVASLLAQKGALDRLKAAPSKDDFIAVLKDLESSSS